MFLYSLGISFYHFVAGLISPFNKKAKLFTLGRKGIFDKIKSQVNPNDNNVWFHVSSLGEFEQARPVIEKYKALYPESKIILTFFSPSGYEIRKNYSGADAIFYLPKDTKKSAKLFLDLVNPKEVYFVKYDFWYNYLKEIHDREIPLYIFSTIFRKNQVFFKWYGKKYAQVLTYFTKLYVQDKQSIELLNSIGITNCQIAGDTRFDRVCQITKNSKDIEIANSFKAHKPVIVCGSTWPKDEQNLSEVYYKLIENYPDLKLIVAPHEIHESHIKSIEKLFKQEDIIRFSNANLENVQDKKVLIINNIGMLSSLYKYGELSYIGGGFGVGIHNILEAVSYSIPVVFGPNYQKFKEAVDLIEKGGAFSYQTSKELYDIFDSFFKNPTLLKQKGEVCLEYVNSNLGATDIILA